MVKRGNSSEVLLKSLKTHVTLFNSLQAPSQVGKTTLTHQAADELRKPRRYVSADLATLQDTSWLQQQWDATRELAKSEGKAPLIIDEIQKIPH